MADIVEKAPATEPTQADAASQDPYKGEEGNSANVLDKETERKLLRKLDIRIVPTLMWIYLMNMMDRGEWRGRLDGMPRDMAANRRSQHR